MKLRKNSINSLYKFCSNQSIGLYPESNGIVGNNFYDPDYKASINFLRDSNANEVKWWNQSEPIWMTARYFHNKYHLLKINVYNI